MCSNWLSQKCSSTLASGGISSSWHQYAQLFKREYTRLVMRRLTGPIDSDIEIIFPMMLANSLAFRVHLAAALLSCDLSAAIFSCGTDITPCCGSSLNPSHLACCDGAQEHFAVCSTSPALARSSLTRWMASTACFSPFTATIPSSRYSKIRRPWPCQYLIKGLNNLVKA